MGGVSRKGGKDKPLKAPKKEVKELDDDDKAFQEKQRAAKLADKQAAAEYSSGKKIGAGLKKSGKK